MLVLGPASLASTLTPPTLSSRRGPSVATREHDITALTPNTTPASVMAVFSGTITISGDGSGYAVSSARIKRLTPRLLDRIATDWVLELLPATRSGHLADELLRGRGRCKSTQSSSVVNCILLQVPEERKRLTVCHNCSPHRSR